MTDAAPGTYLHRLPNGEMVFCWRHEQREIFLDIRQTGSVSLIRDPVSGVYERVPPGVPMPARARLISG